MTKQLRYWGSYYPALYTGLLEAGFMWWNLHWRVKVTNSDFLCFDWHIRRGPSCISRPSVIYCSNRFQSSPMYSFGSLILPYDATCKIDFQPHRHEVKKGNQKKHHKPHRLQKAASRCRFAAHLWVHQVRGFDNRTSPGPPAAGPPASGQWFVPETPALWKQSIVTQVRGQVWGSWDWPAARDADFTSHLSSVSCVELLECEALLCWKRTLSSNAAWIGRTPTHAQTHS